MQKPPVRFLCSCGTEWFSPPGAGCPNGCKTGSTPDDSVWSVDALDFVPISLSAHFRDEGRYNTIIKGLGIDAVLDIAGDPEGHYVWRPSPEMLERDVVKYEIITDVFDNRESIPYEAFDRALLFTRTAMFEARNILFHCAAGLGRSPHILYAVLRGLGWHPDVSWGLIEQARPIVHKCDSYIACAEEWNRERLLRLKTITAYA